MSLNVYRQIPRKICAPENCRMVEGPETCTESVSESTIQQPQELCDLQPQQHCREGPQET